MMVYRVARVALIVLQERVMDAGSDVLRNRHVRSRREERVGRSVATDCRVRMVGGVPTLVIDGQPHSGFCYSTYDTSAGNLERRVAQFAEAGCDIFNFVVEISGYGYSPPLWRGEHDWDFSPLDDRARRILAVAPRAYLLPRIYVDAPAWWRAKHPDEMMVLDDGSTSFGEKLFALPRAGDYPSLASERWLADMRHALRTIIAHVQQSDYADRVIGYQISGQKTEEWYHWSMNCDRLGDYSVPMRQAFGCWLADKYRTDQRLQTAWRDPDVTLATADVPSLAERIGNRDRTFRDPDRERPVIDFHRFWSEIMADTIDALAQTVKEATRGKKVVGAFYAYTFEFAELGEDAGHLALGKLLRSPHVDFIMAPSSYFNRNLPGTPLFRHPTLSLALHGKLLWNDFDQVSFKWFEKLQANPQLKTWEYQMGLTRTPEEFVWMNRREIGMTLAYGVQSAHFDIHGGYYEDPLIMEAVKRLGQVRGEALGFPDRSSAAEILVLVDERSQHYLRFRNPAPTPGTMLRDLLTAQVAELGFVAPYDTALLSDLASIDTGRYKLILVLNAFFLDSEQRDLIQQRLAVGDKTILWFYAPGYFSERGGGTENIGQLTGIHVVHDEDSGADTAISLRGELEGIPHTLTLLAADPLIVLDEHATLLAVREHDPRKGVIARRGMGDWTSIYTATAPLGAPLLKRVAAAAGVHIYDDNPAHLLFANRHILTVAGDDSGDSATIRLPAPRTVVDLETGETIGDNVRQFTIPLRAKEVRSFRLLVPPGAE
jgi:beta-galactosidase